MSPKAGDHLGHYRLDRLIGSGGMGEVYLGFDATLKRRVAIKLVSAKRLDDPTVARRLLNEAQAVAAIEHPGICQVFDADTAANGQLYVVMEYLEGRTLAKELADGPLAPQKALELCAEIADTLAAAHGQGIVHRDLKPLNIIITPSGHSKVLDLGIAKFLPSSRLMGSEAPTQTVLTAQHVVVGTASYMSPEQIQGKPIDGRSDLFALGAVLYECLTGQPAFRGDTVPEILAQVMHGHPLAPSSLRTDLNRSHDDLCFRLLAREPTNRFASAQDAAVALRSLASDASSEERRQEKPATTVSLPLRSWWRSRQAVMVAILALAATALASGWRWFRPSLPQPSADAQLWFQKGTESLREGAYYSAAKAFEEGIRQFPDAPTSYARLAEARAELDDPAGTQAALLQLSQRFPNESVLPVDDRLRVEAMRWLVTRDLEKGVGTYKRVVERNPNDAGAWVDLGRAQETAVQLEDAKASFQRAITLEPQLPAAYLHLGIVESFEGHGEQSLAALDQADRLYRTASNTEGQAEVLIRKGALFDSQGDSDKARPALESAIRAAQTIQSQYHVLRAQLALSRVTAYDGHFAESERLATTATDAALDSDLDVVAADGLVDLGATLLFADRLADAERTLAKASRLATKRGAVRTGARVQTQIASLRLQQLDAAGALTAVEPALAFFRKGHYLKLELIGLNIAARAHGRLDHVSKAYELATKALEIAEATANDSQIAEGANTLAGQSADLGSLPEALALRTRAEAIHRRQHNLATLPYDLTNRAELLIRLGRLDEASTVLGEVEEGISKKIEGYAGRQTRVTALRTLAAVVIGNLPEAARIAQPFVVDTTKTDSSTVLMRCLLQYATPNRSAALALPSGVTLLPATERELKYWLALTHATRGEFEQALTVASEGLQGLSDIANDELRWRLSAVAAMAARRTNQSAREQAMRTIANDSLTRLRNTWGQAGKIYESRRDLVQLRARAGL